MRTSSSLVSVLIVLAATFPISALESTPHNANSFTRMVPLPAPRIEGSSVAYPGGRHEVGNVLDGNQHTEYSSDNGGTNTFIDFDFSAPTRIAAFRHIDRNDLATIASSELTLIDGAGKVLATFWILGYALIASAFLGAALLYFLHPHFTLTPNTDLPDDL